MQSTNARYQELLASTHRMQTQLYIDNVVYGEEKIMEGSLQTKNSLFQGDIPTVGGAVAGEISVQLLGVLSSSVARMAELRPQVRLVGDSGEPSEWVAQGVYNVDKRSYNKQTGVLTLHTTSGDIDLDDISAAGIETDTTSGDLELDEVDTQSLTFTSTSGDISGELLHADEFGGTVTTVSGDISGIRSGSEGTRTFKIETVSGDIDLDD